MVLFFTLFLTTALLISLGFLQGLLGFVETRPQVTVYFQTKATEGDISQVKQALVNTGKTADVKYVSKQQAYANYKQVNKDNPLLLEMVSPDILPASLEIFAKQPEYLAQIADFLKTQPAVDEVQYQKDIVNDLLRLTNSVRSISIILFTFLIVMSVLVLTTTTLFKIALKKDEIELMRLLGASRFYIKKPFLKEAIFFGVVAAIFAFGTVLGILFYFRSVLNQYFATIQILSIFFIKTIVVWPLNLEFFGIVFGLVTVFGILIAIIATNIATNKYLS